MQPLHHAQTLKIFLRIELMILIFLYCGRQLGYTCSKVCGVLGSGDLLGAPTLAKIAIGVNDVW